MNAPYLRRNFWLDFTVEEARIAICGQGELAYHMITKKEYPSYAHVIECGDTTFAEAFHMKGKKPDYLTELTNLYCLKVRRHTLYIKLFN